MLMKLMVCISTVTICSLILSCASSRKSRLEAEYKEIYLSQFKLTYFRRLLAKSYNYSDHVSAVLKGDHSGFTEPVLTEADERFIDSLTTIDNQYLIADSSLGRHRAEGAQGKRPLGYILQKFSHRSIDKLAEQRFRLSGVPTFWTE